MRPSVRLRPTVCVAPSVLRSSVLLQCVRGGEAYFLYPSSLRSQKVAIIQLACELASRRTGPRVA